ncbi:MAG: formate dehydrogenase subunit alpha [Nitrososphaerota archaeon]
MKVSINGELREFPEGLTILEALKLAGVGVPTLCYDTRLKPYGGCRLCIVEVDGWARPLTSCNTMLADGMVIKTHTQMLEEIRRSLLGMIANNYPREAYLRSPEKEFHRYIRAYHLEDQLSGHVEASMVDDSNPYIHVDMSRCVYCFRCVRICEEVQGQFVWRVWNRGDMVRIMPDSRTTLLESSCVSCGACVDTCPTGALEDKTILQAASPTGYVRTTCPYCATGCEMDVGVLDGRIVAVKPALDGLVSRGHLCVKGRYAHGFVHSPDRVTEPMIRRDGRWERVSWETAIKYVAETLIRIVQQHGPDSVAVLASSRSTNEENYLAQKFARVVIGTNNVDCCARVCHAPSAQALGTVFGTGAATSSFDDIDRARTIFICGANPTENHPIVGARIRQRVLDGALLIVVDPRRTELARLADIHLQLMPGTDVPLLNAMANVIISEGLCDMEFIQRRVEGWDAYFEFIKDETPEKAAGICGVEAELIRKAARLYALQKPTLSFHGLGLTEHVQGTEGVMCIANLALLTGNVGREGSGVNPLRGQNNVQGAAHMGCEPSRLTGFVKLTDGKNLFEEVWNARIPERPGLNALEAVDAVATGSVKALWIIGWDIYLTFPNAVETAKALSSAEFIIVQDIFMNETAKAFASVFLPACSTFEKEGTFMNSERRIQPVRKVIEPLGSSKPDWEILCMVAAAMGKGRLLKYSSPREIWDEIRSVWPAGRGITYERLERGGLQWPCPSTDHTGTKVLHMDVFPIGERARLHIVRYAPTPETVTEEYPIILTTGRSLYQFNAGTMTLRTGNTILRGADFLEISPTDAERLGLADGNIARVTSRYGETTLRVRISPTVRTGTAFVTFHTSQAFINRITSPYRDSHVTTPEYKVTAIRLERGGHDRGRV